MPAAIPMRAMKEVKRYEYTPQAAKVFLALIGGGVVAVQLFSLWQRHGQSTGWAVAGVASAIAGAAWFLSSRHRNRALWVPTGRTLGFRPLYSGHFPEVPFDTQYEAVNILIRSSPAGDLYVGHWGALNIQERSPGDPPSDESDSIQLIPVETFALYRMPRVNATAFAMQRPTLLDRFRRRPGLSIPGHPSFSDRYRITSPSESELTDLLPRTFLDLVCRRRDWQIEANGSWLLLSRTRRQVKSAGLPGFVSETDALAEALVGGRIR